MRVVPASNVLDTAGHLMLAGCVCCVERAQGLFWPGIALWEWAVLDARIYNAREAQNPCMCIYTPPSAEPTSWLCTLYGSLGGVP